MNRDPFEQLFGRRANRIRPGLDRMQLAFEMLGQPAMSARNVLVAGTNGKGTTAGFLWQMLARPGTAIGLYTSPHLRRFCERIQLSTRPYDECELVAELDHLRAALGPEAYETLSFFEIATLLAFCFFERESTAMNVIEVGLGGRWDATNVIEPELSVVVSIGLDHQEFLGETLAAIAAEKAGVARPGRPFLCGLDQSQGADREAYAVLKDHAAAVGARFLEWGSDFGFDGENGYFLDLGRQPGTFELPESLKRRPRFIQRNYVLASAARERLSVPLMQDSDPLSVPQPASFTGRVQELVVRSDAGVRRCLIDVAHNPAAIACFIDHLRSLNPDENTRWCGIVGILADKPIEPMLDLLQGFLEPLVLFKVHHERSMTRAQLRGRHADWPLFDSFEAAWRFAVETWRASTGPWIITGSMMAVGEVLDYFNAEPIPRAHGGLLVGDQPPLSFDSSIRTE